MIKHILIFFLALTAFAQENTFEKVGAYLQPDGDFYLFMNSSQVADELVEFSDLIEGVVKPNLTPPERPMISGIFNAMRLTIRETGLPQLKAVGLSSIPREGGGYANRSVIYHGADPVQGQLWAVTAGEPHALDTSLLPPNTVAAISGDFQLDQLWLFLDDFINRLGPDARRQMARMRADIAKRGHDLDDIFADFAGDVTVVLTMDRANTRQLKPGLQIPEFGLMLAASVRAHKFYDVVADILRDDPIQTPEIGYAAMMVDQDRANSPFRSQPTIAKSANRVFLATNPDVIRAALAGGVEQREEFAQLLEGLPVEGNQLSFVSRELSSEVARIFSTLMNEAQGDRGDARKWEGKGHQLGRFQMHGVPIEPQELLDKALAQSAEAEAFGGLGEMQQLSVTVNHPDARVTYSHSSQTHAKTILAPAALASAIGLAIPMVKEAREKAKRAASMTADSASLRQIALAAIQHSDRHGRLPQTFAELEGLPQSGRVWDSQGTVARTMTPHATDYVFVGQGLPLADLPDANRRVLVHSAGGAYRGEFVIFAFADGHVTRRVGSTPAAIAAQQGWHYGVAPEEEEALKEPESYAYRLDDGKLLLLDAANQREIALVHPGEAFDLSDLTLATIAPWEDHCWVGSSGGLFRFDPVARSWSRFAVARTHLDVAIDALTIADEKLEVRYGADFAIFDLRTREWLTAAIVAPPAQVAEEAAPLPPVATIGLAPLLLVVLTVGVILVVVIARNMRRE